MYCPKCKEKLYNKLYKIEVVFINGSEFWQNGKAQYCKKCNKYFDIKILRRK